MCLCCKRPVAACPQSGPRPGGAKLPQALAEVAPSSLATGADWGGQVVQLVAGGGLRWCGGGRGLVVPGAADARVVSGTASSTLEATLRLPWPDMLGLMQ